MTWTLPLVDSGKFLAHLPRVLKRREGFNYPLGCLGLEEAVDVEKGEGGGVLDSCS